MPLVSLPGDQEEHRSGVPDRARAKTKTILVHSVSENRLFINRILLNVVKCCASK